MKIISITVWIVKRPVLIHLRVTSLFKKKKEVKIMS